MNIILSSIRSGIAQLVSFKKLWFRIYLIILFVAILLNLGIGQLLEDVFMYRPAISESDHLFNYGLISDFMNNYREAVGVSIHIFIIGLILCFVLMVIFHAGLVYAFVNPDSEYSFFKGAYEYFWKFLRLSFYFILILIFLAGVLSLIVTGGTFNIFEMECDSAISSRIKTFGPIFLIFASFVSFFFDYIKFQMVRDEAKWFFFKSSFTATNSFFRYFLYAIALFLINITVIILSYLSYHYIIDLLPKNSMINLIIILIISQGYLLFRVGLILYNLSSLGHLHRLSIASEEG